MISSLDKQKNMTMKKIILLTAALAALGLSSCKQDDLSFELPQPPGMEAGQTASFSLVNEQNRAAKLSVLDKATQELKLKLEIKAMDKDFTPMLFDANKTAGYLKAYGQTVKLRDLKLLESQYFDVTVPTIKAGATSGEVVFKLKAYDKLPSGVFYAPIVLKDGLQETIYFVRVEKDGEYVKLSEEHKKPLPPNYKDKYTEPLKMIAYVETNDWDIRNMGQFILKDTKEPVFDMVVLFAANMNYDTKTKKRYIFFNDKLQPIINNPDLYIKPLKDRGIKVIIDILPNHQGVGYRNFQSYEEALEFAKEAKMWTDKLGIDGWDIDEEYAGYTSYVFPEKSALWYARAMKEVMPDKLLTCYDFSNPLQAGLKDEKGKEAKDYIDFIVSNYWVQGGNSLGVEQKKYAAFSIEANLVGTGPAETSAKYNLDSGNGGMMVFNIKGSDIRNGVTARDLSKATQLFYGQDCIFSGVYHNGPKDY